jgi:hypothetical protein
MMLTRIPSWLSRHWRATAIIASAAGLAMMFRLTREDSPGRPGPKAEKDIQKPAEKISKFARETHQAYPTGDVSEGDLAMRLRKSPDRVANALEKLLKDGKVERAPLSGYWKLNIPQSNAN